MKITNARYLQIAVSKSVSLRSVSASTKAAVAHPEPLAAVATKRNPVPLGMPQVGKDFLPGRLGLAIPGIVDRGGLPEGFGRNGIPGFGGNNIPGVDRNGLPGGIGSRNGLGGLFGSSSGFGMNDFLGVFGRDGLPGLPGGGTPGIGRNGGMEFGIPGFGSDEGPTGRFGLPAGFGSSNGPRLKMPGSDRMDGDQNGLRIFGGGTWDFGPNGFRGSVSGGVTYDGYGVGVNEKGQAGVATGDTYGGSVTSPGDAQSAAQKTFGGGNSNSGAPEGMSWSKGTRVKDSSTTKDSIAPTTEPKKNEGPNDLGPSTNDPSMEKKKENETAVAQNDTTRHTQAGKPNPYAMPNPEDTGGGTPRSTVARSSAYFMPNPEDTGGGTPRSNTALGSHLYMPNPEDSGGGTPRSVTASVAMKLAGVAMKLR